MPNQRESRLGDRVSGRDVPEGGWVINQYDFIRGLQEETFSRRWYQREGDKFHGAGEKLDAILSMRERDPLWDSLVDEIGDVFTKTERDQRNKALKELRAIGATEGDIRSRCHAYRVKWPGISLTATALVKHWSTLGSKPAPKTPARRRDPEPSRPHRGGAHGKPGASSQTGGQAVNGQIEVFPGKGRIFRGYYYRLRSANGQVLSVSESYVTKWNAMRAARKIAAGLDVQVVDKPYVRYP